MQTITFEDLPSTDTPIDATNLNTMQGYIEQAVNDKIGLITLLEANNVAPEQCETGDLYYNIDTALIYEATGTDTWNTVGNAPSYDYLYLDKTNKVIYYFNGTELDVFGAAVVDDLTSSSTVNPPSIDAVNDAISDVNNSINQISDSIDALQYNLVENGNPVKTGRKINGNNEYIKYITSTEITASGNDTNIQLNLPSGNINTDITIWIGNDTFMVPNMWNFSSNNYFRAYKSGSSQINANLGTDANWFRTGMKVHIIVRYYLTN